MSKYEQFFEDLYEKESKVNQQHLWVMCNFSLKEELTSAFESYLQDYKSSSDFSNNDYVSIDSHHNWVEIKWYTSQEVYDKPDEELTEEEFENLNEWNAQEVKQMDVNSFHFIDEGDNGMLVYQDEFGRYFYSYVSRDENGYGITITFDKDDYFDIESEAHDTYKEFMDALYEQFKKIPDDSYIEPKWDFDEEKYKKEKTEEGKREGLEYKFIPQKQELQFEAKLRKWLK